MLLILSLLINYAYIHINNNYLLPHIQVLCSKIICFTNLYNKNFDYSFYLVSSVMYIIFPNETCKL